MHIYIQCSWWSVVCVYVHVYVSIIIQKKKTIYIYTYIKTKKNNKCWITIIFFFSKFVLIKLNNKYVNIPRKIKFVLQLFLFYCRFFVFSWTWGSSLPRFSDLSFVPHKWSKLSFCIFYGISRLGYRTLYWTRSVSVSFSFSVLTWACWILSFFAWITPLCPPSLTVFPPPPLVLNSSRRTAWCQLCLSPFLIKCSVVWIRSPQPPLFWRPRPCHALGNLDARNLVNSINLAAFTFGFAFSLPAFCFHFSCSRSSNNMK